MPTLKQYVNQSLQLLGPRVLPPNTIYNMQNGFFPQLVGGQYPARLSELISASYVSFKRTFEAAEVIDSLMAPNATCIDKRIRENALTYMFQIFLAQASSCLDSATRFLVECFRDDILRLNSGYLNTYVNGTARFGFLSGWLQYNRAAFKNIFGTAIEQLVEDCASLLVDLPHPIELIASALEPVIVLTTKIELNFFRTDIHAVRGAPVLQPPCIPAPLYDSTSDLIAIREFCGALIALELVVCDAFAEICLQRYPADAAIAHNINFGSNNALAWIQAAHQAL